MDGQNKNIVNRLFLKNPMTPKGFGHIKLHKKEEDFRVIVDNSTAPSRLIAQQLNKVLQKLDINDMFSVKNTSEFVDRIKNVKLSSTSKLYSIDVVSLFPSIPIKDTLEFLREILSEKGSDEYVTEIMDILETTLQQNYFQFDKKIYILQDGLTMGNPLSSFLSNLYLCKIEQKLLESCEEFQKCIFYARYIDDICMIFDGSLEEFKKIVDFFNNQHPNIKVTFEEEKDSSISYLDLKLVRSETEIIFDIYRKPTNKEIYIKKESAHVYSQKVSPYYYMFNRLYTIPLLNSAFLKEQNHIYGVAREHGFKEEEIMKIEQKVKKRIFETKKEITNLLPCDPDRKNKKTAVITFNNCITRGWRNSFRKLHYKIAFKPGQQLYRLLRNNKDKIDVMKKAGVYAIECTCGKSYIGQTQRNIGIRFKEHKDAILKENLDYSGIAKHIILNETGSCGIKGHKMLHTNVRNTQLDFLESLEIHKNKNNVNLNSGVYVSCESFKYLL